MILFNIRMCNSIHYGLTLLKSWKSHTYTYVIIYIIQVKMFNERFQMENTILAKMSGL